MDCISAVFAVVHSRLGFNFQQKQSLLLILVNIVFSGLFLTSFLFAPLFNECVYLLYVIVLLVAMVAESIFALESASHFEVFLSLCRRSFPTFHFLELTIMSCVLSSSEAAE
jgi:predicted tellurium resistance membrane protein TerC